jgi:hypothetical protein
VQIPVDGFVILIIILYEFIWGFSSILIITIMLILNEKYIADK